nr:unnamed protein product [Callosobruchus analis]
MGTLKAAKTFGVPRSTVQRLAKMNNLSVDQTVEIELGRGTVLDLELEEALVSYILEMEAKFYGLTRKDVQRVAFSLAERNGIEHPFGSTQIAGRGWLDLFLQRHRKTLSIRKPTGTSFARARGFNKENVNTFFTLLQEVYERHDYPANRIFNVDETGLTVVQNKVVEVVDRKVRRSENEFDTIIGPYHSTILVTQPPELVMEQKATPSKSYLDMARPSEDNTQPGPSGIQKKLLSPFDISPIPVSKKKHSHKGRKGSEAAIITSSPYQQKLLNTPNKNKQNVKAVKKKRFSDKISKKTKKQLNEESDSEKEAQFIPADEDLDADNIPGQKNPDDSDAECLFCERKFSEDRRSELWVQCLMCDLWRHVECAGAEKDEYVCDFCHIAS